jgi:hypothetical protein
MRAVRAPGLDHVIRVAIAIAMAIAGTMAASGCVLHHWAAGPAMHAHRHGPPPHAPAHGYRYKQHRDGVELVFDSGLGVYLVADWPDHYWYSDHYLRWSDGYWSASVRVDGGWVMVGSNEIPDKLRAKHARNAKRKQRSKHGFPARHAD